MLTLEMAIDDALFRIRREYERTKGKIYLSFSGGKDSTVVANLIKMADLPTKIPFVFANTRIELDATVRFVKEFDYENVVTVFPRKPFGQILKDHGKPVMSKMKSDYFNTYQRYIDDPMDKMRGRVLITGEAEAGGVKFNKRAHAALPLPKFHLLHPDLEYPIANMCCQYMKKYPFQDFANDNEMNGTFTGVRAAEEGVRRKTYTSCVTVKMKKGKEYIMSHPIIDWTDEIMDEFIEKYNIKLSDAYTIYGANRTGCIGCPFAKDLPKMLKILYDHEPLKYKASLKWLGDVYMDQDVELPWDDDYMAKLAERREINKVRRKEMYDKYKHTFNPNVRKRIPKELIDSE